MASSARRIKRGINVWPGYVDALAALLMVVMFVLLVFVVGQLLLSDLVNNQESELADLHQRIAQLTADLGIARATASERQSQIEQLSDMITVLTEEKFDLSDQLDSTAADLSATRSELEERVRTLVSLQEDIAALRAVRAQLEAEVGQLAGRLDETVAALGAERDRSKALSAELADQRERTLLAQQEILQRDIRVQALLAVASDQEVALAEERELSADARAEMALLDRQLTDLRARLEEIAAALDLAEQAGAAKDAEIADLGRRLNVALAREVNRLARYRSEFFATLSEALGQLGDSRAVQVVGDRFVFPSELLFASGSATLGVEGRQNLNRLAENLLALQARIPPDLDWILRVDGHTDRVPIGTGRYASNWELSTARALSVVRYLAERGVPEMRMAAAGFGEHHPIDPDDSPAAYARNRRIELKLTAR